MQYLSFGLNMYQIIWYKLSRNFPFIYYVMIFPQKSAKLLGRSLFFRGSLFFGIHYFRTEICLQPSNFLSLLLRNLTVIPRTPNVCKRTLADTEKARFTINFVDKYGHFSGFGLSK